MGHFASFNDASATVVYNRPVDYCRELFFRLGILHGIRDFVAVNTVSFRETASPMNFNFCSGILHILFVLLLAVGIIQQAQAEDSTPPNCTTITPSTTGPSNANSISFDVHFDETVTGFTAESDLLISHSGTSHSGVTITLVSGAQYTVSVNNIAGDGAFTIAVQTGSNVQDTAGNNLASSVTSAAVTIDNTGPAIIPYNITVYLDGAGNASIHAGDVTASVTDPSGIGYLNAWPNAFTCADIGQNFVTISAADTLGNASNETAIVTVQDVNVPWAQCQSTTVSLDDSGFATITSGDIDDGSADNCGFLSRSVSPAVFSCANLGSNNVTLTVTDYSGLTDSCTAVVTVEDAVSPDLACDERNVLTVNVNGAGHVSSSPAGILNCTSVSGECVGYFAPGTDVTLTAVPNPLWNIGTWFWNSDCVANDDTPCLITMSSDKTVDVTFDCQLIATDPSTSITSSTILTCIDIAALDGYEILAPDGDATFIASNSIALGPGFMVESGATFQAIIE